MLSTMINSSTWTTRSCDSLAYIQDLERRAEQACADGDYEGFSELAEQTWGIRIREGGEVILQHRLDLVTAPDWKHYMTFPDGSKQGFTKKTFLHAAAKGGNVRIVEMLANLHNQAHVTLNCRDSIGRTPFFLACNHGNLGCADAIYRFGRTAQEKLMALSTADSNGQTPFHAACDDIAPLPALVVWLYELGVNIEARGVSFVHFTNLAGARQGTARIRATPLVSATIRGHVEIVRLLLGWGASRNAQAEILACSSSSLAGALDQKSAFHIAKMNEAEQLVGLLESDGVKRQRRKTPMKDRAAKVNVQLPPTPEGVRDDIAAGSPNTKKEGKRRLQIHQTACHKKVERAEICAADPHATRSKRYRALRSDAKTRHVIRLKM